jgi:hypothetical protein
VLNLNSQHVWVDDSATTTCLNGMTASDRKVQTKKPQQSSVEVFCLMGQTINANTVNVLARIYLV